MSSEGNGESPALSLGSLVATSNVVIISAPLRDLREVLREGPELFSQVADSTSRNEVIGAVLDLKQSLQGASTTQEEDKANSEKLFDMPTEELTRLAHVTRPTLVRLMQSALRFDTNLQPKEFEPSDPSSVITVALSWKLDATQRALHNSISANQNVGGNERQSRDPTDAPTAHPFRNDRPAGAMESLPVSNPFPGVNANEATPNRLDITNIFSNPFPQKRAQNLLTLKDIHDSKLVKFSNLGHISSAHQGAENHRSNSDFRGGGSTTDQLPPHLMGEYIGRVNTQLILRVFEFKGAEILAGLLQEGTTVELAVKNRRWRRPPSGEPYQTEQEAINLARTIHLTLMAFATVEEALNLVPWLENCLRRLYTILYVEDHAASAHRSTLWKLAGRMLETQADSSLQVPSMEKMMAQNATLFSKEQNALASLAKKDGKAAPSEFKKRKRDSNNEKNKPQ